MTAIERPETAPSSAPGGLVKSVVELDRVVTHRATDFGMADKKPPMDPNTDEADATQLKLAKAEGDA